MANIIATPSVVTINPIPTLDGKGEIVWYDDFETGPPYPIVANVINDPFGSKWYWRGSADAGSRIALSSAWSKSGMFSLKLQTGNTAPNYLWIYRAFPYIQSRRLGFEFSFLIPFPTLVRRLTLDVLIFSGGSSYEANMGMDAINGRVFITDPTSGEDKMIAPYSGEVSLKYVIDQVDWRCVRAVLGNRTLPLSEDMFSTPGVPSPSGSSQVIILLETGIDASAIAYIDDFIITRREV